MTVAAAGINIMLDRLGLSAVYAGLLSTDGSTEMTSGSPAYTRKAVTWTAAAGSSVVGITASLPAFDVPATTVTKVILTSAVSSGTTYATIDVTDEVFAAQGTYTLTSLKISGS
jgi:hypothetical protein